MLKTRKTMISWQAFPSLPPRALPRVSLAPKIPVPFPFQTPATQARAEKPLGTASHRTISKRTSKCWLLIWPKKCFVLLCPIGQQHLLSSFREFVYVHDGHSLDYGLSGSCTKEMQAVRKLSV